MAKPSFEKTALYGAASVCGLILAWLGNAAWGRLGAAEMAGHDNAGRIGQLESRQTDDRDLLKEVRSDVKEILRRLDNGKNGIVSNP